MKTMTESTKEMKTMSAWWWVLRPCRSIKEWLSCISFAIGATSALIGLLMFLPGGRPFVGIFLLFVGILQLTTSWLLIVALEKAEEAEEQLYISSREKSGKRCLVYNPIW